MALLTAEHKQTFQDEGYLVLRELVDRSWIDEAKTLVWEEMEEDRDDPTTWVDKGYRTIPNVGRSDIVRRIINESPVFQAAEELAGEGVLNKGGGASPHFAFPRSDKTWRPPGGHLDGYYTPTNGVTKGTTGRFMMAVTIYLEDIGPNGGGFTLWPRTHRLSAEYFRTHPIDGPRGGQFPFPVEDRYEFTGGPGDVCIWHGWMYHGASTNINDTIRMALITRLSRKDQQDWKFDLADGDLWSQWDGLG